MTAEEADKLIYTLVLQDLQLTNVPDARKTYLETLIASAKTQIQREGIVLQEEEIDSDQCVSIAMYAAYLYRKRADGDSGMPRMLRRRLNDWLCAQKMGASDDT